MFFRKLRSGLNGLKVYVGLNTTIVMFSAHLTKLSSVETRLDASQRQVEELERQLNAGMF